MHVTGVPFPLHSITVLCSAVSLRECLSVLECNSLRGMHKRNRMMKYVHCQVLIKEEEHWEDRKGEEAKNWRIQGWWCTGHPLLALQKIYKWSNYQTQYIDFPITVRSTIWPNSHLDDWIDMWHFISQPFYIFLLTQPCFLQCLLFALLWKIGFPDDDPLRKQSCVSHSATPVIVPSIKILSTQNLNKPHWLQQFSLPGDTAPCWQNQAFDLSRSLNWCGSLSRQWDWLNDN